MQDRRSGSLPEEGQQIRVTLTKDLQIWEGNKRVVVPSGTTYEGTAAGVDTTEGFFDLVNGGDVPKKFYVNDSTILVEIVEVVS